MPSPKKKTTALAPAAPAPHAPGPTPEAIAIGGTFPAAVAAGAHAANLDTSELMKALETLAMRVEAGDSSMLRGSLVQQLAVLQLMFGQVASRAQKHGSLEVEERLTALALRIHAECRRSAQALDSMMHPRAVAFIRQTNVAHNQQVNIDSQPVAGRKEFADPQNELEAHGRTKMDT